MVFGSSGLSAFPFEIRGMLWILLPRAALFLRLPAGHGFLRGFRELFVSEPAKIADEGVLPGAAEPSRCDKIQNLAPEGILIVPGGPGHARPSQRRRKIFHKIC